MNPEQIDSLGRISDLSQQLDIETEFMSGGYENLDAFQEIVEQGESAISDLLSSTNEPSWWRLQAVWTIASDMGVPIEFQKEIIGKYTDVRDITLEWAQSLGYITSENAAE